ncbi:MAG: hypothetical protein ACLPXT_10725 [Terracidiphilus sp.]
MELILNLFWALLATLMLWLWMRHAPRECLPRQTQLAALAVVILILLPIISVTDDLRMAQNPAEADAYYLCTRRDHVAISSHSIFPAVVMLPPPVIAKLSFGFLRFAVLGNRPAPLVEIPALASIQNRPPPAA